MRRNHTREYRRNKRAAEHYSIEYIHDPSRPRLRHIVHEALRIIFVNAAADWDANESQRIGIYGKRRARDYR